METHTEPRLLITAAEAAQLLGCSVQTVKRLAERGDLKPLRFGPGGHVRFRLSDVEEFVSENEDT
jgi:excisionase family DNA binding protein